MRLREVFEVAKVKLSTDPDDYGAYVKQAGKSEPTTTINFNQIVSTFEPEEFGKMKLPKSAANVKKIIAGIKRGDELPPLLVRRYKNGYQVLDGHHRYEAYKQMGVKQIPVRIVDPKNIKQNESKLLDKKTPTVGELAEKYKTSIIAVELQLKKGVKVEMEHTKKHSVAKEIALDHLGEDLYYYEKLAKIEKKTNEGEFRSNDVEEFKPSKEQLSNLKSKYLPDWEMLDHRILQAEYTAKDHRHADQFTKVINKISEEMDHFCEVTQDVAEVTVKTTTSDVKGLTLLDFQIAMRIDKMAEKMDIEQIRSKGNFDENFADGKGPGRPGDSGRHGIPKGATIAQLEKASKAKGRKGQLARWQLNMRRGKKKG